MNSRVRVFFYASMILLLALISAISVIPARADDGAPPPPAAPAAGDPAQVTTAAAPTVLSQVPAGANVVVVNDRGHKVSLASQEAAKIVASGDPIWCPTGVLPGGATCSSLFTTFTGNASTLDAGLLSVLTGKTVSGTIWISSGYDSSLEVGTTVTLDGSLGTTANYALTLKGGWNGTLGSGTTNPATPSTFTLPLIITGWNADVTLSDIEITGVTSGKALDVETSKNITLTNVNVHDNTGGGSGAYLNNTSGLTSGTTDKVTVTSSQFNGNNSDGLDVFSWGAITVSNLTASSNIGRGAALDNCSYPAGPTCNATSAQPVTLTGSNTFTDNWLSGLEVYSIGSITTNNLTADNNGILSTGTSDTYRGGVGVWLENGYIGAPAVTLNGINEFNGNYAAYWNGSSYDPHAGLVVNSSGAITANSLTADNNVAGSGAFLDNCEPNSLITCYVSTSGKAINVTGLNTFTGNHVSGLEIFSKGAISTNNVTATNNATGWGENLVNYWPGAVGGIAVSGTNLYAGNWYDGLAIFSHGAITVNNATSNGNGQSGASDAYGVYAENDGAGIVAFTMTGTNNLSGNLGGGGLFVQSKGAITINSLTANGNTPGYGAYLNNTFGTTGTVTVNYSTFNDNTGNGLEVYSNRAISVKNITALNNGWNGAYLDNCNMSGGACATFTAQPVTITSVNNFNWNVNTGLVVWSEGAITLSNVTAIYNSGGNGAYLDNCNYDTGSDHCLNPGSNAVTLKGSSNFSDNGLDGLEVWASGPITTNNLTADYNGQSLTPTDVPVYEYGAGVYLENDGALLGKPITLTGTNSFTGNGSNGLYLRSGGAVKANNLTANGNGLNTNCQSANVSVCGDGVHVDWSISFTLTGYGTFNGNGDDGLDAASWGAISLTNLSADGNNWWGVGAYNDYYIANPITLMPVPHSANITLTGTNVFTNNQYSGLYVETFGAITLNNVTASYNGQAGFSDDSDGALLDNCLYDTGTSACDAVVPKPVTFTGINTFNDNFSDGLWGNSLGAITAKQVTANDNGDDGAYLDNQFGFKNFNITLSGNNVFNNNHSDGLEAYSNGSILISNLTANGNTDVYQYTAGGVYLDNRSTTSVPVTITLTGINTFNGNGNRITT